MASGVSGVGTCYGSVVPSSPEKLSEPEMKRRLEGGILVSPEEMSIYLIDNYFHGRPYFNAEKFQGIADPLRTYLAQQPESYRLLLRKIHETFFLVSANVDWVGFCNLLCCHIPNDVDKEMGRLLFTSLAELYQERYTDRSIWYDGEKTRIVWDWDRDPKQSYCVIIGYAQKYFQFQLFQIARILDKEVKSDSGVDIFLRVSERALTNFMKHGLKDFLYEYYQSSKTKRVPGFIEERDVTHWKFYIECPEFPESERTKLREWLEAEQCPWLALHILGI